MDASPVEQAQIDRMLRCSAIGGREKVRAQLATLLESTAADEFIVTAQIYDHRARLRSFGIAAEVMGEIGAGA